MMNYGMDDEQNQFAFNPANIPAGLSGAGGAYSPYLNIDPRILRDSQPQYIMPEGQPANRGRFELAFTQIGYGVMTGFAYGGLKGLYSGVTDQSMKALAVPVWRTQMLNYLVKHSSASARPFGTAMVFYAFVGTVLSKLRQTDDELNTFASGTLAGAMFRSTTYNLVKILKGAGIGAGAAAIFILADSGSRQNVKQMLKLD